MNKPQPQFKSLLSAARHCRENGLSYKSIKRTGVHDLVVRKPAQQSKVAA